MKNAGLRGPRPESFQILSRAHRDRDILMPRNLPICLRNFIEEDATDREYPVSEHRLGQLAHPCRFGQLADFCKIQKVPHSKDSAAPEQFFAVFLPLDSFDQRIDLRLGQNAFLNGISINFNLARDDVRIGHDLDFKVRHKSSICQLSAIRPHLRKLTLRSRCWLIL